MDPLSFFFLAEGEQVPEAVLGRLLDFIRAAKQTLDFAVYDMRLNDSLKASLLAALRERAKAGVAIRICFHGDKPLHPNLASGQDPAPPGTSSFVQSLGFPSKRITGMKLMHHKFIVRDGSAVWTGSLNLTDDAFTLMENNVVQIDSPELAASYAFDFDELWRRGNFDNTGEIKTAPVPIQFNGESGSVRVMFSPGCGQAIDTAVAERVKRAQRRVRICSMLLNSGALIGALQNLLREGRVQIDGVYDQTQMADVYRQWQEVPSNKWKIPAVHEIVQRAGLVGKNSTPYTPTSRHDFMHNKVLVIDDAVITGSYNFSRSAEFNAENILFFETAAVATLYSDYIDHLRVKYSAAPVPQT